MKNCWPDGDLRAYIDGELELDSRERIAAHVEACSACGTRYRELAERAAWVSAVMDLSESALAENTPAFPATRPRPRRWLMGAVGLAAALAIAFLLLPQHPPVHPTTVAKVVARPSPAAPEAVHPVVPRPGNVPSLAKARVRSQLGLGSRAARRQEPPGEEFVRLDDDPIETATVVRISADNGALQADLIVGPDGRAHAIRIVRNQ